MADRDRSQPSQLHRVPLQRHAPPKAGGPSASQVMVIIALLPVGGTLLGLAGVALIGTLIGLAVTAPLFIIVSPVLVPAVIFLGLVATGLVSSGAFGLTGLSTLTWVFNYFRSKRRSAIYGTNLVQIGQ